MAAGLATAFALASYLTNASGQPITDPLRVQASALAAQAKDQIDTDAAALTTEARIIVSDQGKLNAVSDLLPTDAWKLPPDPKDAVPALSTAVKRWFAESLVPAAYWLMRGTPPPDGPSRANDLSCYIYIKGISRSTSTPGTTHRIIRSSTPSKAGPTPRRPSDPPSSCPSQIRRSTRGSTRAARTPCRNPCPTCSSGRPTS